MPALPDRHPTTNPRLTWSVAVGALAPAMASHSFTVLSAPQEASAVPARLKARPKHPAPCASGTLRASTAGSASAAASARVSPRAARSSEATAAPGPAARAWAVAAARSSAA